MGTFNPTNLRATNIDWKAEAGDALYGLRATWPELAALRESRFDELCENYNGEDTQEQLAALGQELSACGLALYSLPFDGDEYRLTIVAEAEAADFEAACKAKKWKIKRMTQPRRQPGQPAKRIDLGARVPCESCALGDHVDLNFAAHICLKRERFYDGGAFSHDRSSLFDARVWPPSEIIFPHNIGPYIACSEKHGVWAAVFEGGKGQENRLMVSRAPLDVNSWREIPFPTNPLKHTDPNPHRKYYEADDLKKLSFLFWAGKDLLITYSLPARYGTLDARAHVWAVKNAADGGRVCEKVFVSPTVDHNRFSEYPRQATTGDGRTFFMLAGRLYTWDGDGGKLNDAGIEIDKSHTSGFFPMKAGSFGALLTSCGFVEFDIDAKTRTRWDADFQAGDDYELGRDWLMFTQAYSRAGNDNLAFWNRQTGAWHELPVGAFGKARVRQSCHVDDGNILFEVVGTQSKLCRVTVAALFDFLAAQKKKVHAPPRRAL